VNPSLKVCNSLPGFLQLVLQGAVIIRLGLGKGLMWDGSCRRLGLGSQMLLVVRPGSHWTGFTTAWRELERLQYSFCESTNSEIKTKLPLKFGIEAERTIMTRK